MAWMGQQAHIFAGSVQRNVALGRERCAAPGYWRAALQQAGLGTALAQRQGSSVGEGGQGLSGGEAVRLALARMALHQQAGLWLVDEANRTSRSCNRAASHAPAARLGAGQDLGGGHP